MLLRATKAQQNLCICNSFKSRCAYFNSTKIEKYFEPIINSLSVF